MSVLPAYLGIWGTHALYEVMKNYAEINHGSKALLVSLNASWCGGCKPSRSKSVEMERQLRSLRELRIKVGSSAFYYDKQLVMTVGDIVLNQAVSLLVMS